MLDHEEYIEQAYLFRVYRERLAENVSAQEALDGIGEEILATTRLPMAIDFLRSELVQHGRISEGMARLSHYFAPFQAFVMAKAEDEDSRFDIRVALAVLEKQAEYLADEPTPQGLFIYQFESVARNRLGYGDSLKAIAADPMYDDDWRTWISRLSGLLGTHDFAELLYRRSEHRVAEHRRRTQDADYEPSYAVLFGIQEGRIARANIGRDPLYMFAALQRQLGYPKVPRPEPIKVKTQLDEAIELRFQQMEAKIQVLEAEIKGSLDLSEYYKKPQEFGEFENS
jgi:hypothetical protein